MKNVDTKYFVLNRIIVFVLVASIWVYVAWRLLARTKRENMIADVHLVPERVLSKQDYQLALTFGSDLFEIPPTKGAQLRSQYHSTDGLAKLGRVQVRSEPPPQDVLPPVAVKNITVRYTGYVKVRGAVPKAILEVAGAPYEVSVGEQAHGLRIEYVDQERVIFSVSKGDTFSIKFENYN